eukprot:CAMPEP_0194682014 /NCGR_PEP_ID=MMETSP0295-20121207/12478_1 /TAXON_ID=39354 /ORGANISM="Heterosigma akashiwo, Strain CCMP2393" /LENGTH=326 /DNA_ID=CAMNT_0039568213 /DNA_START=164 /DNA_END=1141 /DNA_ORIENTATION=-
MRSAEAKKRTLSEAFEKCPEHEKMKALKMQAEVPQMMTLKVEHALEYIEQVKAIFKDRPNVYDEFTRIMGGFEKRVMDTPGVISRVSKLFAGHQSLITGFNNFLPTNFKTDSNGQLKKSDRAPAPPSQYMSLRVLRMEDALTYVDMVRQEFADNPAVFAEFQDTVRDYGFCKLDTKGVVQRCLKLFEGHQKLVLGLNNFLPPELGLAIPADKAQAIGSASAQSLPRLPTKSKAPGSKAEGGKKSQNQIGQVTQPNPKRPRRPKMFVKASPQTPPASSPNTSSEMTGRGAIPTPPLPGANAGGPGLSTPVPTPSGAGPALLAHPHPH